MSGEKLRPVLDPMKEEELLALRDEVEQSPAGSNHEIGGVETTKEQLLWYINQSLVIEES